MRFIKDNQTKLPYSTAIEVNNFFITSGQIPDINLSKKISTSISKQTKIVLEKIYKLLKTEKISINNIIKITIFTTKMNFFNKINIAYKNFFDKKKIKNYPTRSCIGVYQLPYNVDIEMEVIALSKK